MTRGRIAGDCKADLSLLFNVEAQRKARLAAARAALAQGQPVLAFHEAHGPTSCGTAPTWRSSTPCSPSCRKISARHGGKISEHASLAGDP